MAWSYSGDPSTSDRDRVRFLVGDTDALEPQLQNEEIDHLLAQGGGPVLAAVQAAEALAARYARRVSGSAGGISRTSSDLVDHYLTLARRLRAELALFGAPYAGGLSKLEKAADRADSDLVQPALRRGMFDHDGAAE